jgi:hypothetical protein
MCIKRCWKSSFFIHTFSEWIVMWRSVWYISCCATFFFYNRNTLPAVILYFGKEKRRNFEIAHVIDGEDATDDLGDIQKNFRCGKIVVSRHSFSTVVLLFPSEKYNIVSDVDWFSDSL